MTDERRYPVPEGEHSPLGPSSSDRWLVCTGSVLYTKGMPDKPSQYAVEGTAAHTVSEWAREEGKDAEEYIGREVEVHCADGTKVIVPVDQEMADGINAFVEYTDALPGKMLCEERVTYTGWVPNGFGTADDIRLGEPRVYVTDLKYGKGVQKWAENNTQLMLYALGVYQDYGHLYDIKDFQLAIFQPRLNHVDEWIISVEDLLVWANTVAEPTAKKALTPGAGEFIAGDHCQFCRARQQCRHRAKYVHDVIYSSEFENLDEEPVMRDPNDLTLEEIGLLLPMIDAGKAFFTDLEARAYAELGKGHTIPHPTMGDWKLVEGRSNRCLAIPEDEVVVLLELEDIDQDKLYTKKLVGIPALEKLLGKKHPLLTGDSEAGIVSIVKKPRGAPKLVPGIDKRPSMEIHADEEFQDLDET